MGKIRESPPHLHGGEELPAVHALKVAHVSEDVQTLGHDGEARHLHKVQAAAADDVARGEEADDFRAERAGVAVKVLLKVRWRADVVERVRAL